MSAKTAAYLKDSVHHNSIFSKQGILERLFTFWFNSFVYNQIWEDPRVDLEAMELTSTSRVMTISSGGCNVLNYLIHSPEQIVAVDLNRNHICLLKLKLAAIQYLPTYDDFFLFFGVANDQRNFENYHTYLAEHLDEETREFWEGGNIFRKIFFGPRIKYFTKNFYDYAKLGYFLRFLGAIANSNQHDPSRLLTASTKEEQLKIYEEEIEPFFDHWLVRAGGRLPVALYSLGIPPSQFTAMENEVGGGTGGGMIDVYRERAHRLACQFPIADNYFCWQALTRTYDRAHRLAMPEYLREENFEKLRANLSRVTPKVVSFIEYLQSQPDASLDRFVLLDSQDWMRPDQINAQWAEMARVGRPGTRIIFRTAASDSPVEKALSPEVKKRFVYEKEKSLRLFQEDRSAIYGGFHLYTKP